MAEVEIPNIEEIEEVRAKRFTRRVALTTAIFAVALAITSLGGNNAMKEMLLAQQQASDQWAFYQSKVIREHIYRTQKDLFQAQFEERGKSMPPSVRSHYQTQIKTFGDLESRYRSERAEIEREARKLEHERDVYRSRDPYFDYAEAMLQIAIVMASISILATSRPIFYFSIITAVIGCILCFNGYTMLFR